MFSYNYDIEIDLNTFTPQERELFGKLSRICYGYTENKEEIKKLPQYYYSDQTVVDTVNEVCNELKIV